MMKIEEMERPKKLRIVAITGRSGSGKSSVAAHYASLGHPVADGDVLSRQVVASGSACLAELCAAFGGDILLPNGELDRKALGRIAFSTPRNNQKLIDITHPYIAQETLKRAFAAQEAGRTLFFVDGAMVVGVPFQQICDVIILVTASLRLSVSRIILRDGISKMAAYQRLEAQQPEAVLRAAADYVIENDGTEAVLKEKADAVLRQLTAGACE